MDRADKNLIRVFTDVVKNFDNDIRLIDDDVLYGDKIVPNMNYTVDNKNCADYHLASVDATSIMVNNTPTILYTFWMGPYSTTKLGLNYDITKQLYNIIDSEHKARVAAYKDKKLLENTIQEYNVFHDYLVKFMTRPTPAINTDIEKITTSSHTTTEFQNKINDAIQKLKTGLIKDFTAVIKNKANKIIRHQDTNITYSIFDPTGTIIGRVVQVRTKNDKLSVIIRTGFGIDLSIVPTLLDYTQDICPQLFQIIAQEYNLRTNKKYKSEQRKAIAYYDEMRQHAINALAPYRSKPKG